MSAYRRFKFAGDPLATVATLATVHAEPARSVATVACVASRASQTTKLEILPDSHEVEIEERKGMATDGVPGALYLNRALWVKTGQHPNLTT